MDMAAYTQFGYAGYPTANQHLLSANDPGPLSLCDTNAPSPLSGGSSSTSSTIGHTNEATLMSPVGPLTVMTQAPLNSPGAMSQTSTQNNNNNTMSNNNNNNTMSNNNTLSLINNNNTSGSSNKLTMNNNNANDLLQTLQTNEPPPLPPPPPTAPAATAATASCCENGRPIITDPVSGQTVCSCQYDTARLAALSGYPRSPASAAAAAAAVYGATYPSNEQNPYQSLGVDSSAFYSPLSNPYGLKESAAGSDMTAWTSAGLQTTTGYYSYDPALAAYGYGAGYDLASRRKNATRESTATLKAWLNEHKKNPYPTKGEKIMLAIITKMTLTQVSTWFANARRRLKKENKMTWEPKNKTEDDDDDAMMSDDEKSVDKSGDSQMELKMTTGGGAIYGGGASHKVKTEKDKEPDDLQPLSALHTPHQQQQPQHPGMGLSLDGCKPENLSLMRTGYNPGASPYGHHPYGAPYGQMTQQQAQPHHYGYMQQQQETEDYGTGSKNPLSRDCGIPIPASKPKIWSLADTVACKTPPPPPPPNYMGHQQQQQHHYYHHNQHQPQQQQQQQLLPRSHDEASPGIDSPAGHPPTNGLYQPHQTSPPPQMLMPAMGPASDTPQMPPMPPMPLPAHSSPLSMMSSYVAGSPYSRIPTAYTGGPTASYHPHSHNLTSTNSNHNLSTNNHSLTTNSNNHNLSTSNSSNGGSSHGSIASTPTTPPIGQPPLTSSHLNQPYHNHQLQPAHHLLQQQPQQHHQQRMASAAAYSEIQPDTPPQTPPNIKAPSTASSLANVGPAALAAAAAAAAAAAMSTAHHHHTTVMPYSSSCADSSAASPYASGPEMAVNGNGPLNARSLSPSRLRQSFAARADA